MKVFLAYRVHAITNETIRNTNTEKEKRKVGKDTLCALSLASTKEKGMQLAKC